MEVWRIAIPAIYQQRSNGLQPMHRCLQQAFDLLAAPQHPLPTQGASMELQTVLAYAVHRKMPRLDGVSPS